MWNRPDIDPAWWSIARFEGRHLSDILRAHDVGALFRFLSSRGWSRSAVAAATGLSETRVREVALGRQQITSYEVLVRVASGLRIARGAMGLAFTDEEALLATDDGSSRHRAA